MWVGRLLVLVWFFVCFFGGSLVLVLGFFCLFGLVVCFWFVFGVWGFFFKKLESMQGDESQY